MISFNYSLTTTNWKMVFSQGEYKLTALIILIVPFMLCLKPDQEWVNPRDLAGMYVLVASFDINLAIRDLLTDRNTAAMITWTEVVFYSMWNFLKVYYNFCNNFCILYCRIFICPRQHNCPCPYLTTTLTLIDLRPVH